MAARSPSRARVTIPALHASQQQVYTDPARFRVLACGRRWGKTRLGAVLCIASGNRGGRAWWIAPSYPVAAVGWRLIRGMAAQIPGVTIREGDRLVEFASGGSVQVRSADNPDSLRGDGLDLAVIDECAFVPEAAWTEALRPALADRKGRALFISTPKGRNWFWRLWVAGQGSDPDWQSWQLPTTDNPYIDPAEVEAARAGLPERVYLQEFCAEFLEDGGGIFRGVHALAVATPQDAPLPGHTYCMGVDWGKLDDFTVLCVMDVTTRSQAAFDRFNQIDYTVQTGRLRALAERFGVTTIIAERNSMGEPLIEAIVQAGLPVTPFLTTNATKAAAIDALALAFERREITILPDPALLSELDAYEAERLPSGLVRYQAPSGVHDDCVMALALAWQACSSPPAASGNLDRQPVMDRAPRRLFGR